MLAHTKKTNQGRKKGTFCCEKVKPKEIIRWEKKNQALVVRCHSKYLSLMQLF